MVVLIDTNVLMDAQLARAFCEDGLAQKTK